MKILYNYINEKLIINKDFKGHLSFNELFKKYNLNNTVDYDNFDFDMRYNLINMLRISLIEILHISTNKKVTKRNANTFINIEFDNDEYYWTNSDGDTFDYRFKTDGTNTLGEIVLEIAQTYLKYYDDFAKRYETFDVYLPEQEYLERLIEEIKKHIKK